MCQSMVSVKMWEKNSILSDYNSQTLDPISNSHSHADYVK